MYATDGRDMYSIFDAVTGQFQSRLSVHNPTVDTSGALIWHGELHPVTASSGHAFSVMESLKCVQWFRYGLCVISSDDELYVVRFDGA